jgi:nitroimidazol reductase NimA-like FMN-containing flavoprotein (pyridoxamine 5'-phosphate oxidase superfamily)
MESDTYARTPETSPTRHKERVGYDRVAVYAAIDEAVLCHVGFVVEGRPVVLPQLHARDGEVLYLHGSSGARALRMARTDGLDVCITITHIDGLVLARSAFNHSINYRSVVIHGVATEVTDRGDKQEALARLVDGVVPGRSQAVRGPSPKELAATTVLRVPLERVSLKVRSGPPADDAPDLELPYWAGVLPLSNLVPGYPESDPGLGPGVPVPAHVTDWNRKPGGGS